MRTALFQEGSAECPVLAIMDFEPAEVASLQGKVAGLARHEVRSVVIDGEVRLTLRAGERDVGILETNDTDLACVLRASTWLWVVDLLQPFTKSDHGDFQWLDETGRVKLLISRSGQW